MERFKDYLRGFLIPYSLTPNDITSSSSHTTYEPFADIPIPTRDTGLFVGATGNTLSNIDLQVYTSKSGNASSAQYLIKDKISADTKYGNNSDSLLSDWNRILAQSTIENYRPHDTIEDGEGGFILVYDRNIVSPSLQYRIACTHIDASGNRIDNDIFEFNNGFTTTQQGYPCLTRLNDGSYLCLMLYRSIDNYYDLMVFRSTDKTTFELASQQAFDIKINGGSGHYTIEKMSCESLHGQILLCISAYSSSGSHTHKNHLLQYASVDGGGTFKKVTTDTMVDEFSFKSIQVYKTDNQFSISYIASTSEIHNMIVPHAFFQIQSLRTAGQYTKINSGGSSGDFSSGTDSNMTSGFLAAHYNPNGSIFVYVHDVSDNTIVCFYTEDNRTWSSLLSNGSTTYPTAFFISNATYRLDRMFSCAYNGGSVLIHDFKSASGSIAIAYFGGFTNTSMPARILNGSSINQLRRTQTTFNYVPICLPSQSSELVDSGTGTESLLDNYAVINVSPSQTKKIYTRTKSIISTSTSGIIVHGEMRIRNDDNENAITIVQLQVDQSTGARRKLLLEIYNGRLEVFDNALSKTSIIDQEFEVDARLEFIMSINNDKASFFWRATTTGYDALKLWFEGFIDYNLNTAPVATVSQSICTFGIDTPPSSSLAETHIYKMFISDNYGFGDITNLTEDDLIGKRFSITKPQYITDGVGIFAQRGPTYIGDEWNIKATSNNSIDNIFHYISPSPRVQWWSESVGAGVDIPAQSINFQLASNEMEIGNDIIGLHLSNINFRDARLIYWDSSISNWVTLFDFKTSAGMKHAYVRSGKSIKQSTPNFDNNYYFRNELKDYVAMLAYSTNVEFFNVVSNTEGGFGDTSGKLATVILDGEPSFDGVVYFIPKNVTVVCNLNGIKSNQWRLQFPAQKTIDNQLRLGGFHFGEIAIAGTQYSKGRRITIESGSITTETPDRTRYSKSFAPDRRTVQISWSDGVDISSFYNTDPDPDYYKSSSDAGALPVSAYQDAPYLIEGILRQLNGDQKPLVYLPSITTSNDNRVYNRRDQHMLAVIDGEINIESITGEELRGDGVGEVMRIGSMNLLEIV